MELRDDQHIDGVVQVLHRAKSGTLRTRSGSYVVRPAAEARHPGDHGDFLFDLDFVDKCDSPESLQIDALELNFDDAVFAVEGSAVQLGDGYLRVARPLRVFSSTKQVVDFPIGKGHLVINWQDQKLRTRVRSFSVDQFLVDGFDNAEIDLSIHVATFEFTEDNGHVIEVPCTVAFGGFSPLGYTKVTVYTSTGHRPDLVRVYRLIRFPKLRDRGELSGQAVVELFRASHYLDLRETDNSEPTEAWCCPDFAGDLSIDTIFRASDDTLLGHVSVTRAYSRTWLGHQLTTLKGHDESADCRIALYNHFASVPTTIDGIDNTYLLGYYDRSKRWHQLFFEAFVAWIGNKEQVSIVPFDRYEPLESATTINWISPEVQIVRARGAVLDEVARLVAEQLPALATKAFDIEADKLDVAHLHPEYGAAGVVRGREAFALFERKRLVGAALCETGSRHLSLFNLFNLGQMYFSKEHGASRMAKGALARFVRAFYADRGILDPVLVSPPEALSYPGDAGLRLDETMGCIIWSGHSLEQYQSYIRYCFEKIGDTSLTTKPH